MTDDRDDEIRRRAHALWEAEGRPDGRHEAHWRQATREVEASSATAREGGGPGAEPEAAGAPGTLQAGDRAAAPAPPGRSEPAAAGSAGMLAAGEPEADPDRSAAGRGAEGGGR